MSDRILISKEVQFDAGHRVPKHDGKCRFPHGHRYRVVATCEGEIVADHADLPEAGMLADFGHLKRILMAKVHDELDHKFIVWEHDEDMYQTLGYFLGRGVDVTSDDTTSKYEGSFVVFPFIPTAENIARWCYVVVNNALFEIYGPRLTLSSIEVWETPTSMAMCTGVSYDARIKSW